MIPYAGDELTELIVQQYLVDFQTAEKMKLASSSEDEVTYEDIMSFPYNSIQGDLGAGCPDGGEDYFRGGCKDQGTEWG